MWNLRRELHLDINAPYGRVLMVSGTNSALLQPPPDFVAGDGGPVRVYFWQRGENGALVAADPGPDTSLIFTGRPQGIPTGSDLLFETNDFTEISAGVWEGTLDLTPEEFTDHLATAPAGAKVIIGEIEVRDSVANTKRTSLQFPLTARPQVYENQDTPLGLPTPEAWLEARRPVPLALSSPPIQGGTAFTMTGANPAAFNEGYTRTGTANGKPSFISGSGDRVVYWDGEGWVVDEDAVAFFVSNQDVAYPWQVAAWTPINGGVTPPTVTQDEPGTVATVLGQLAISTMETGTFSFRAIRLVPMIWEGATPGLSFNIDQEAWQISYITGTEGDETLSIVPI